MNMEAQANPYLPPETVVADAPVAASAVPPAFPVSITKLVVMCVATLGGYQLYWFYKHWVAVKRRTGESIWPFWRMFFSIVWCFSLFSSIQEAARKQKVERWHSAGSLAAGWAITSLLQKLPDPWWMVSLLAFLLLIPVQREANDLIAKVAPDADRNSRFTLANWAWIALMSVLWALLIIDLMLPPEPGTT